ncbi:unnamed protein product [Caenorhabditis brenneri]
MTSCHPEEPYGITITHYITSIFSIPVYGCAFLVLFFKCPTLFNTRYRNYLVTHIVSGVLLEIHMSVFWRVTFPLPVPTLCSHGLSSKYSAANFQIFIYLLMFTAVSALSILIYRMKATILYAEHVNPKLQKVSIYIRFLFYVLLFLTVILSILINPELNNQMEYKSKMEKKLGSPFPDHFWCHNCIFMVFDSILFIIFFIIAYCTIVTALSSATFSAFVTYRILHSSSLKLSKKTAAIQRNVLYSLIAAFVVHVVLLFVPLVVYFSSNFITIDFPAIAYICILMVQEHGACSAFTLLVTNNLLRKSAKDLICFPARWLPKDRGTQGAPSDN